jgi:hypothetical protein
MPVKIYNSLPIVKGKIFVSDNNLTFPLKVIYPNQDTVLIYSYNMNLLKNIIVKTTL